MDKVRIGVMGCAAIARNSVIPAIKSLPDKFDLVCIASRSMDKAIEFASEFACKPILGYEDLLNEELDAVYIPLPTGLHEEWITRALQTGKHVYAEKSIAKSYESARNMVLMAGERHLALMEGYMFLYHTQHKIVRNLIATGEIGEPRTFRSSFGFPPLESSNFRYKEDIGGGALFDAAGYPLRATHFLMGNDFEVVAASLYTDKSIGTNIFGSAFLKGKNGIGAQIAFGFDNFYQCNYEIWGSKGKITAARAFTPKSDFKPNIIFETHGHKEVIQAEACNHFIGAMDEFYNLIFKPILRKGHYKDILLQSNSLNKIFEFGK